MKKYQDSKITNADFEVTYVGWIAEEELMKGDKEKRKNLRKIEILFLHVTEFVLNRFTK
jgi:hypothetical protein